MSKIKERIIEIDKSAKRSRLIAIILGVIIIAFIVVTGYLIYEQIKDKQIIENKKAELQVKVDELTEAQKELKAKDLLLTSQNERLREVQGRLDTYWEEAVRSDKIKDYADYLLKAIKGDKHYDEALIKMNELANKTGYVQITDSNGTPYLSPIKKIDTDVTFYIAQKAMRVRRGVIGDPNFSNTSQIGNKVVKVNDVVRLDEIIKTGGAEWGKIAYGN